MQIRTTMISLGVSILMATPAFAEGFYVDGGISMISVEGDDFIAPLNGPDFDSLGAHFGFDLSKHFSIEGEAIIGLDDYASTVQTFSTNLGDDPAQIRETEEWVESSLSHLVGAYVRGNAPVTSKLNVFGRLGIAQLEIDHTSHYIVSIPDSDETPVAGSSSRSISDIGAAFGAGATYELTDKIYIRGDLTRYDLDHGEVDNMMIGAGIRF